MRTMPTRGVVALLVIALAGSSALAQRGEPRSPVPVPVQPTKPPKQPKRPPILDMDQMGFVGTNRKALLLTFLERAQHELERATLERRSFVPELIRTIDAESL